jgi:hypothetical protein
VTVKSHDVLESTSDQGSGQTTSTSCTTLVPDQYQGKNNGASKEYHGLEVREEGLGAQLLTSSDPGIDHIGRLLQTPGGHLHGDRSEQDEEHPETSTGLQPTGSPHVARPGARRSFDGQFIDGSHTCNNLSQWLWFLKGMLPFNYVAALGWIRRHGPMSIDMAHVSHTGIYGRSPTTYWQ